MGIDLGKFTEIDINSTVSNLRLDKLPSEYFKILITSLITSQDELVSPYHGSSAHLVLVGVEPGTFAILS